MSLGHNELGRARVGALAGPADALRRNEACSVLELGAGAGLTGIFVGLEHESTKVTLTDGDDGVLDLLRKNCHRNRVQARVAKLVWQADEGDGNTPVSYTHLTLPTKA